LLAGCRVGASSVEVWRPVRRRPVSTTRRIHLVRWIGLAVVLAIAVAYVQPIRAYLGAKDDVRERRAERAHLLREKAEKRRELAISVTDAYLEAEARRLGLVREGERLFIVTEVRKSAIGSLR
jgi:hypothetical protein